MYLDKNSYEQFKEAQNDILTNPKKPDKFCVVVGGTGDGKSNFTQAVCYDLLDSGLDGKFGTENIVFEKVEWDMLKTKIKRGDKTIFDEGINVFFSRNALSSDTKEAVQEMVKIRGLGIFFFICIPTLRLLDWYIREDRPHFIIKVKSPKFRLWSFIVNSEQTEEEAYNKLQRILKEGFDSVKPDLEGTWNPVDGERWEKYEDKKARHHTNDVKNIKIIKAQLKANEYRKNCWTDSDLALFYGVTKSTARMYRIKLIPKKHYFLWLDGKIYTKPEGKSILDKRWQKYKEVMAKRRYSHPKRKSRKNRSKR